MSNKALNLSKTEPKRTRDPENTLDYLMMILTDRTLSLRKAVDRAHECYELPNLKPN